MSGLAKYLIGAVAEDTASLARLVSLAARVEPELLRAVRLRHLPRLDAGIEADLWFSPLVQASSPLGLVFRPDVLTELRKDLPKVDGVALLKGVWETIRLVHEAAPDAVRLEEHVTYLCLSGAAQEEIENALLPAVAAISNRDTRGIVRWAMRVLPRLPERARDTRAAQALDLHAARHGKRLLTGRSTPKAIELLETLTRESIGEVRIGVRLLLERRSPKWEFSHPPADPSYDISVPDIDPIYLEITWRAEEGRRLKSRQLILPQDNYITVSDPGAALTVTTASGKSYLVSLPESEVHRLERLNAGKDLATDELRPGEPAAAGFGLRAVLRGHGGAVFRVAWSPDGALLAAPSGDRSVYIWDTRDGKILARLEGHSGAVLCAAWSPDGQRLATGSDDNGVCVWDVSERRLLHTLSGHLNSVSCLAWSPDGAVLASGSNDNTVRLWDARSWALRQFFSEHDDWVRDLVWSPDGLRLASCGDDQLVYVRNVEGGSEARALAGHTDWVRALAWSPDGRWLASGADDHTIRVWDADGGRQRLLLEGHLGGINRLAFSSDGALLASQAGDNTTRLWWTDTWATLLTLDESAGDESVGLAFHPQLNLLANLGERDTSIRIWEFDVELLRRPVYESVQYVTAKIVLLGDSGVGKTGLGWRLAHGEFKEQSSTHGQQFWVIDELSNKRSDGTQCEAVLWDLAGQPAYRQTHSIFLDNVAAALILFDPSNRQEPLRGVQYWLEQLKGSGQLPPVVLVGARVDVSPPALSQQELEQFCQRYGIRGGYVSASAKKGEGLEELLERLKAQIPWDEMTATVTTVTFKRIKDYVLALKEQPDRKGVLVSPAALREQLQATDEDWRFTDAEMLTAVGHLETHGYVAVLRGAAGEQHILLTPELLVTLASSVIFLADKNPRELGAVSEAELLRGEYPFDELAGLSQPESQILLDAAVLRFLQHNICFRETLNEETLLIFPALIRQKRPLKDDLPATDDISYVVRGRVENLYASLAVLLGHTPSFTRINQWRNQAQYEMNEGEICGFRLIEDREGEVELVLYYNDAMPAVGRLKFRELFEQFLYQRDVEVTRFPPVVCPNGHRQKRATVVERVREGKRFVFCDRCGSKTDLPDFEQPQTIGINASPWLRREEAAARLRSAYEVQLTKVKAYRRGWATPRCYISRLAEQDALAKGLTHDLRDAGVYVVEHAAQVQPEDFVIVLDTPAYQNALGMSSLDDAPLVRARIDGGRRLFSLELSGQPQAHRFGECTPGSFYDETHYPVSLFDLVLSLYAIPLTHVGFAPLRQALHQQWEETLAGQDNKPGASRGERQRRS